jgi:hypothetical protein
MYINFLISDFIDGFEKLVIKISVGKLVNLFFESKSNGEFSSIFCKSEFIFSIGRESF